MAHLRFMTVCLLVLAPTLAYAREQFTQDLALGSQGQEVAFLQEVLCQNDLFPNCVIDGNYGPETQDAVTRFQYKCGARQPTGSVDSETRDWLNAMIEDGSAADFNGHAMDMLDAYWRFPTDAALADLNDALEGRGQRMHRLFVMNQRKAREFAFPKQVRNRVPKTSRFMVEVQRAKAKGTVVRRSRSSRHLRSPP